MIEITKEDILEAIKNKRRKRRILIYEYYKDLFEKDFSAEVLAKKISEDLGEPVNTHLIYNINKMVKNPDKKSEPKPSPAPENKKPYKPKEPQVKEKKAEDFVFKNKEEEKRTNKFDDLDFDKM